MIQENLEKNSVTIIGGGPVGLDLAINLIKLNPNLHVRVLEARSDYTLTHNLHVDQKHLNDAEIERRLQEVVPLTKGQYIIPHNKLCDILKKYAQELHVDYQNKKVNSLEELKKYSDNDEIVVAADGAHSHTREMIFGENNQVEKHKRYVVLLKYKVEGQAKPLSRSQNFSLAKGMTHFCVENVSENKVDVAFFVNEATYNQLKKLKNPSLDELPQSLKDNMTHYVTGRQKFTNEVVKADSMQLSETILSSCKSPATHKVVGNQHIFLVGDAANVIPYDRSVSFGIRCAGILADEINTYMNSKKDEAAQKELGEGYSKHIHMLSLSERAFAKMASYWVKAAEIFAKINPINVICNLHPKEKQESNNYLTK